MKIQVYGSGCDKCKKLAANVETAAKKLSIELELEKVTDIAAITDAGILMTPALAIDGKVVSCGKVLSPEALEKLLNDKPCSCDGMCQNAAPEEPKAEETPCCCCSGAKKTGKKYLTAILLLFVFASLTFMFFRETTGKTEISAAENQTTSVVPVQKDVLTVYYFHGTQRCMTCNKIEQMAKEAIHTKFAEAMTNGQIVFRSVNVDEAANEHFIRDFQLATRTVVMEINGKYEKFDAVWTLVREPEKFTSYLQDGATKMMESGK